MKLKILEMLKRLSVPPIIVEFLRFLSNPKEYFEMLRDYKKTFLEAKFIREKKITADKNKTVVFALASGMIYEVKVFAMLICGLKMAGWDVVILGSRYYGWAKRYLRAFGIDKFIYWEDFKLPLEEKKLCSEQAEKFKTGKLDFREVKNWLYRDAKIGPQIISSVSRYVMQGAPDLKDPFIQRKLWQLLPETLETVHKAEHMLGNIKPRMMVVIEANYAIMGALVDTAIKKGVNVIQAVQPARDDAMIFKKLTKETRRFHPASVTVKSLDFFKDFKWNEKLENELWEELRNRYGGKWFLQSRNQPGVKRKTKEDIVKQLGLDPAKKIAVVFSHVLWDANLFFGDDLFEDYGDWFVQTVRAACKNPKVNWIIKLHPANAWKRARESVTSEFSEILLIKKEIGQLPLHVKLLYPTTDISTWSLFESADYGVTVRGTIGMEMTCFGAPIFTAGTGRYSDLGFTNDSSSKEEYLDKMARIQEFGRMSQEELLLAKKHAYIVFHLRPWVFKSFKAEFNYKKTGVHPLDNNLHLVAKSFDEIEKNGDLKKWALFAQDTAKIDYLDEDGIEEWRKSA